MRWWSLPICLAVVCCHAHSQLLDQQSYFARGLSEMEDFDDLIAMESVKQEKRLPLDGVQDQAESIRRVVSAEAPVQYGIKPTSGKKGQDKVKNINPFSLFPPEFHPYLSIPTHHFKNGSSYTLVDKYKKKSPQYWPSTTGPSNPIVMSNSYANTKLQGYAEDEEPPKYKTQPKVESKDDMDYIYVDDVHPPTDNEYYNELEAPTFGSKIADNEEKEKPVKKQRLTTTPEPTTFSNEIYKKASTRQPTPATSKFPDPVSLKPVRKYQNINRERPKITLTSSFGVVAEPEKDIKIKKIEKLVPTTYKPKPFQVPSFKEEPKIDENFVILPNLIEEISTSTTTGSPPTTSTTEFVSEPVTFPSGYKQEPDEFYPLGKPSYDEPPPVIPQNTQNSKPFVPQPTDFREPFPGNAPGTPLFNKRPTFPQKLPFPLEELPPEFINNQIVDQLPPIRPNLGPLGRPEQILPGNSFPRPPFRPPPQFPPPRPNFDNQRPPSKPGPPLFRPEQLPPVRLIQRPPFGRPQGLPNQRPFIKPQVPPSQVIQDRKDPDNRPPAQFVSSNPANFPFKGPFPSPFPEKIRNEKEKQAVKTQEPQKPADVPAGFPEDGFVPFKPQWFPDDTVPPTLFPSSDPNKGPIVVNRPNQGGNVEVQNPIFPPNLPPAQNPPIKPESLNIPPALSEEIHLSASQEDSLEVKPPTDIASPSPHRVEKNPQPVDIGVQQDFQQQNNAPIPPEDYPAYPPFDIPPGSNVKIVERPPQQPQAPLFAQGLPPRPVQETRPPKEQQKIPSPPQVPQQRPPLPPSFRPKNPGEPLFEKRPLPPQPRPPFTNSGNVPPHLRRPRPTNATPTTSSFDFFSWLAGR